MDRSDIECDKADSLCSLAVVSAVLSRALGCVTLVASWLLRMEQKVIYFLLEESLLVEETVTQSSQSG